MTFATQKVAWSHPPVDDVGYIASTQLMGLTNSELRALIRKVEATRYRGWRNHEGRWREVLKMDDTTGCRVLDYGCGIGIEALQYAKIGNNVYLADISAENLALADRVLQVCGYDAKEIYPVSGKSPFALIPSGSMDVIHCSGVLHHIPKPVPVVRKMADWLTDQGELRLMLYSDRAWLHATGSEPPAVTAKHPDFMTFVRKMDGVGDYADWYDREKIQQLFGEWFEVVDFEYITENEDYLAVVLRKF